MGKRSRRLGVKSSADPKVPFDWLIDMRYPRVPHYQQTMGELMAATLGLMPLEARKRGARIRFVETADQPPTVIPACVAFENPPDHEGAVVLPSREDTRAWMLMPIASGRAVEVGEVDQRHVVGLADAAGVTL